MPDSRKRSALARQRAGTTGAALTRANDALIAAQNALRTALGTLPAPFTPIMIARENALAAIRNANLPGLPIGVLSLGPNGRGTLLDGITRLAAEPQTPAITRELGLLVL